jgi:PQQ-dependent catabolism-associated CXXCW motif protein
MSATPAQLFDGLARTLAEMRGRFGAEAFSDRRRVIAFVADKVPDAKRETRAVGTAIDEGVPGALARTERHMAGVEMDRLANGLESATGLRLDIARQIVRSFAFAYELGPLPSVYEAPPVMPAAGVAGGGDWAGLSVAVGAPPPVPGRAAAPPARGRVGWLPLAGAGLVAGAAIVFGIVQMTGEDEVQGNGPAPFVQGNGTATAPQGFAGELVDRGVQPKAELETNVGSPTPLIIPVGQRVTTMDVQHMLGTTPQPLIVDVLANPHPRTLQGAVYIPAGGMAGTFQDGNQAQFTQQLAQALAGDETRPIIFFCEGPICWESYNAMLRANAAGYGRIFWYRGGIAAWSEAGLPMGPLPAPPSAPVPQNSGEAPKP